MAEPRLTSSMEAAGLVRRAQSDGDFAAVLRKGDPERGSLLIVVRSRGRYVALLERNLAPDGQYRWGESEPGELDSEQKLAEFLQKRASFDTDLWVIELDIAHPERFIAETTGAA